MIVKLTLLAVILCLASSYSLSIFYCGFGGAFCGQSRTDDINPKADFVLLAFANIKSDGGIIVDDANFPTALVTKWKRAGKKVLISVGGQSGNWTYAFASSRSISAFSLGLAAAVQKYNLDGADLDLEYYGATPRTVANTIISLKKALGTKLLMVSPQCVTVYQGTPVPSADTAGNPFNYFVPIINLAGAYIDYYQIQAYNNWYDNFAGGSLSYLQDVYLNWRNLQGLISTFKPISGFNGVSGNKILMGMLASSSAGGPSFYTSPSTVRLFKSWLTTKNYAMKGFMMWDSHWDSLNSYVISNVIKE